MRGHTMGSLDDTVAEPRPVRLDLRIEGVRDMADVKLDVHQVT